MKLSIIIANYNTSKLTIDCINSVFENRPKCSFEVIVVDDASPDGSSKKLIELQNKYKQSLAGRDGKRLKVLLNLKNVGYVRSNNRGLLKSKGEYKLLLNSDTLVRQNSIDELIAFAEKTSDVGVVGSRLLNKDGSIQDSCYDFPTVWNAIGYKKFVPNGEEPTAVDIVVGASFLITPKAYKLVGRLSEKYKSYFEDFDYCRETKKKGLQVYYNPKSVVTHFHGESFKQLYGKDNSWKKLIPSSIAYHGLISHYLIFIVNWTYQKIQKLFS